MSLLLTGHATEVLSSLEPADKTTRGTEIILHIARIPRILEEAKIKNFK
jgi:hypothetical protein